VSGTALSVSWLALLFAVAGYILKRWWDNADSIMEHRTKAYGNYFAATYDLGRELMHRPNDPESELVLQAYEKFQNTSADFLLHASPRAMIISDEFFNRFAALRDADRKSWTDEDRQYLVAQLNEALGVLREQLKSEMFLTQPRFQLERFRHRKEWDKLRASTEATEKEK
jgi:hypothetical protein